MVVYQSVVTSLGIKRMHVLYFLVTSENTKLTFIENCFIVICPSGSIFFVQHHVKVPKTILC
jgi:hypothetical protein